MFDGIIGNVNKNYANYGKGSPDQYAILYYSNSNAKPIIDEWYTTNITGDNATKVATGNYFCEAAKVKNGNNWVLGDATMTYYKNYTPDLKCPTDGNGKGLMNMAVGMITYDELALAGGYPNQRNADTYAYEHYYNYWSMSPAGISNNSLYTWNYGQGDLSAYFCNTGMGLRPVINLKASVTATKNSNGYYVVD